MNSSSDPQPERVWEAGWDDHRQKQLERLAKLSLAEKLAWLEEAHRMVVQIDRARRKSEGDGRQ
jgi:hypothetical protein